MSVNVIKIIVHVQERDYDRTTLKTAFPHFDGTVFFGNMVGVG